MADVHRLALVGGDWNTMPLVYRLVKEAVTGTGTGAVRETKAPAEATLQIHSVYLIPGDSRVRKDTRQFFRSAIP